MVGAVGLGNLLLGVPPRRAAGGSYGCLQKPPPQGLEPNSDGRFRGHERTETIKIDINEKPKLLEKDVEAINQLNEAISYVDKHIAEYKLHLASEHLYHYTWHTLADVLIEERKEMLFNGTEEEKISADELREILALIEKKK